MWVLRNVLINIRKYGFYQIEQRYLSKLSLLNEKLKKLSLRNQALENNQKNNYSQTEDWYTH
jgi:sulfur relay (sulfurtransferase) DsrF/TusC family protein